MAPAAGCHDRECHAWTALLQSRKHCHWRTKYPDGACVGLQLHGESEGRSHQAADPRAR